MSGLNVREGSIPEALIVESAIPEFGGPHREADYSARLRGRSLILVAEANGQLVGFKVGHETAPDTFYSWLGGVVPQHRGTGVAGLLRQTQEQWAVSQGFERIRVKSRNRFPNMLHMLIGSGYQVIGTEGTGPDCKIVFECELTDRVGRGRQ